MKTIKAGILLVDKPAGITSHAVVGKVRRTLGIKRVGHLGTLDPFATGLLPVMVGNMTRLSDNLMGGRKGYLFRIQLGKETDTLDITGRVIKEKDVPDNFKREIEIKLLSFLGQIQQVPPVYSAIKMKGRPLYEYMRANGELPMDIVTKKRSVEIYSLEMREVTQSTALLRVECSKGTYVRSLARDIALSIGTVGFCCELRRDMALPFRVEDALPLNFDDTWSPQQLQQGLMSPFKVFPDYPVVQVPRDQEARFQSGNAIRVAQVDDLEKPLFIQSTNHLFLGCFKVNKKEGCVVLQPSKKIW